MPTVLELYEKLQPKLGEDEAQALIACVEASVERKAATQEDLLRTEAALKEDLQRMETALRGEVHRLDQRLEGTRADLGQKLEGAKAEFGLKLEGAKAEFGLKLEAAQADLLKWSFACWIGNVAVMSGIMFVLIRTFAGQEPQLTRHSCLPRRPRFPSHALDPFSRRPRQHTQTWQTTQTGPAPGSLSPGEDSRGELVVIEPKDIALQRAKPGC
jgi:hypothetical protein